MYDKNNLSTSFSRNKNILSQKKFKYYPITTSNTQENNTIYLVAEDIPNLELSHENYKKNNLINKKFISNNTSNTENKKFIRNYSINNYNSINPYLAKNFFNNENKDNINSSKKIIHSYSVDNYSSLTNKTFDILGSNLKVLEHSKIMEKNFINGIRDKTRKNNLINALNIYKKYKSLGNINKSFNFETENNNKNNINKIKTIINQKNAYNIILEDENENSENDAIKNIRNKNVINNNMIYYNKKIDNKKIINIKPKNKNNLIKNISNFKYMKNSNSVNYINSKISHKDSQQYIKPIQKEINKVYSKRINKQNKN